MKEDATRAPHQGRVVRTEGEGRGWYAPALLPTHVYPSAWRNRAEVVEDPDAFDAVVPVPLHRARLGRRGFNQAARLARGLAGRLNTLVSDTLQVVRSTRDQVELSAAERRRNVAGAFSAGDHARGRLLLVDDVFTTGATTSACAAALLDAGAAEVHAVTLCGTC